MICGDKDVFLIEQGHYMKPPSPSVIGLKLNLEDGTAAYMWCSQCQFMCQYRKV